MASPIITIDGPSGSGKTTVGLAVAERLGLCLIDTGLVYRAVAYECLRWGKDPRDGSAARDAARELEADLSPGSRPKLRINGRLLDPRLRSSTAHLYLAQVERAVPLVARQDAVRTALLPKQRALLHDGAVLLGRDVGTTVCPEADLKVYLRASAAVRARRLHSDHRGGAGLAGGVAQVRSEIERRDDFDTNRASSPLRVPPGALILDTESLSARAVTRAILAAFNGAQARPEWPLANSLLMTAVTSFFDVYLRLYCEPIRLEGLENVPSHGPVIVAARHVHNADVNFLAHYSPRQLQFLAKSSLFEWPLIGYAIHALRAIPVQRNVAETTGLRRGLKALADGGAVCIFPEGTRHRDGILGRPYPGAGLLALRSGAPVVPAVVDGLERLDLSQLACPEPESVAMRFGPPFRLRPPAALRGGRAARWASWAIMHEIARLLPESASAAIAPELEQFTGDRS